MSTAPGARRAPLGPLLLFFVATYALTWTLFITVARGIPARSPLGATLILLGAWAPSFVALAITAWRGGGAGVRRLVAPILQGQVAVRWYLFAAGYMVAIKLAAALIHRLATGTWPRFGIEPLFLIPFAILFLTPPQAGEEIGWRGYALPRLAQRMGLAWASVVLGLIWALWHLPQFYIRDADTYGQSFPLYVTQVVALSVAIAWLWARTGMSLLLPMLLHSAVNNSKDIVPSATPGATHTFGLSASLVAWLGAGLLWVCAAYFLWWMARTESQRTGTYRV